MASSKTVMIALGGNALSPKSEAGTITEQFRHTKSSLRGVMHFVRANYNICITHGNGPQIGAELSRNEISMDIIPPLPLNVLVANTQGAIGYMIQQSLQNALYKYGQAGFERFAKQRQGIEGFFGHERGLEGVLNFKEAIRTYVTGAAQATKRLELNDVVQKALNEAPASYGKEGLFFQEGSGQGNKDES